MSLDRQTPNTAFGNTDQTAAGEDSNTNCHRLCQRTNHLCYQLDHYFTVTDLHYTASLPPGPMAQQQQRSTAIRSLREGSGKSAAIYHCCARPDRSDHAGAYRPDRSDHAGAYRRDRSDHAGAYRPDRSDHAGAYVAKKPKIEEHCTKCMQWYLGEAILRFFAP